MHPQSVRRTALEMHATGIPLSEIHRKLEISRNTVASWIYARQEPSRRIARTCWRCDPAPQTASDPKAYSYLLGQYLGDGHLLLSQRIPLLTVACDNRYLGLIHEVTHAMESCGTRTVGYQEKTGCISVRSHWRHWPCLLPQAGPGPKHLRSITLVDWQQEIVATFPQHFARGLLHSDGSRFINRVKTGGRYYAYPSYNFVNESGDIMRLCQEALDRMEVAWRMARRNMLAVTRRDAVAQLDRFVGPKW